MGTIKILLVGGGRMGSGHLAGIAKAEDLATVTAAVEPFEASQQRLRQEFGINNLHTDLDAALAAESVDAVFICTPNNLHAEYALKCLRAGKHVFVEKPLALTVADADEMVRTAAEHDRLLMSGQTLRFSPRIRQVKQLLAEGCVGEVRHIVHRRMSPGRGGGESSWFARQAASGGILPGIGSHSLDAILWWLEDRAATVYAVVRNIDPHPEVDIEDEASLVATTIGGVLINVAFSFHHKVGYEWIVAGSEGVLQLSSTGVELQLNDAAVAPSESQSLPGESDIHREFFTAIRDGRPLAQAAGADVRHSVALVCAAQESGRTGQAVAIS